MPAGTQHHPAANSGEPCPSQACSWRQHLSCRALIAQDRLPGDAKLAPNILNKAIVPLSGREMCS